MKNGYLLHQTGTVIVIATGTKRPSDNRKTGAMVQIWILLRHENPVEALINGNDAKTICKGCPFASQSGCYVNVGQAPLAIWKAYNKGNYPFLPKNEYETVFKGKKVRFGAYGNPSKIPLSIVKLITDICDGWTGYFHDWLSIGKAKREAYNRYFMVSTESESRYQMAKTMGLRAFHASDTKPKDAVECPNSTHGVQCADCRLCSGQNVKAKNVWIALHGATVNRAREAIA